jgi:two-component system LytT family sensor kinase
VRGQWLHFNVRNSYSPGAPQREVGGVGLANVRKRLALHYPATDYTLDIQQNAAEYAVLLTLHLTPTVPAAPLPAPVLASYA